MPWERRDGCASWYYTRSRKVNGRVVREYVGSGPLAQIAAERDEAERRRRADIARHERAERARLAEEEAPVAALDAVLTILTKAILLASGYHQHERGEWRRRKT